MTLGAESLKYLNISDISLRRRADQWQSIQIVVVVAYKANNIFERIRSIEMEEAAIKGSKCKRKQKGPECFLKP